MLYTGARGRGFQSCHQKKTLTLSFFTAMVYHYYLSSFLMVYQHLYTDETGGVGGPKDKEKVEWILQVPPSDMFGNNNDFIKRLFCIKITMCV